jgi:hypothetical protein
LLVGAVYAYAEHQDSDQSAGYKQWCTHCVLFTLTR